MVASVLSAGDIAIVSYETDVSVPASPDALRFVLLKPIGSGTQIFFTDRTWTPSGGSGSFAAAGGGEGTFTYTTGVDLPAGTVITLTAAQLSAAGITLSNAGETIYAYQGTSANAPATFLFAIDVADGNNTFSGSSLTNTGLTSGTNAVAIAFDNATFVGSPTGIAATNLAAISNNAQWYGLDLDDNPGTPNFTEVIDTVVQDPFFGGHDFVIIAGFAAGGQSEGMLRIGAEDGALTPQNVTRVFRDRGDITNFADVAFDLESGYFFVADSDGNGHDFIVRGNIADLVSGNQNAVLTQIVDTPGTNGSQFLGGVEVDKGNDQVYWWYGNLLDGWTLSRVGYTGGSPTIVAVLDDENAGMVGFSGAMNDWALDLAPARRYAYAISNSAQVDGNGDAAVGHNHIVRVALGTGVITVLPLGVSDSRSSTGGGLYVDGRLDPAEGVITALDVHQVTGVIYFVTQPISGTATSGVWSYDPATDVLTELWEKPSRLTSTNGPLRYPDLEDFPTANMWKIEVDEIGGRLFIGTLNSTNHENDGTPSTNENDASIHVLAIGAPSPTTAPTRFVRPYEPTSQGAPTGMEIDYDSAVALTTASATYTESTNALASPAGPVITPYTNVTITDPDTTMMWGATVAITNGFVLGDALSFVVPGGSGITTTGYNASTGAVTFSGLSTFADYQTLLNSIRYTNAGDNPTNYGANQSRTLSITAFDGLVHSDLANVNITVAGVNDAPVNTVTTPQAATEEVNKVITGLSVSDVDADPATQDITVTLQVTRGTLTVNTGVANGLAAGEVSGNGTATVVLTGTQNQINTMLANVTGVTFAGGTNVNGTITLTVTTNDQGLNGNDPGGTAGSEEDIDTVTINVANVNDAPTVAGDGAETLAAVDEDTTGPAGATVSSFFGGAQFSDAADNQSAFPGGSSANAFAGIAIVNNAANAQGTWQWNNGGTWTGITSGNIAANALLLAGSTEVRFLPAENFNGAVPALTAHLVDNSSGALTSGTAANLSGGGTTGGTTRYSQSTVTLDTSINAVNDAPNVINGTAVTLTAINEDSTNPAGDTVTNLFVSHFSDADDSVGVASVDSLSGVAITANPATAAQGVWQYFTGGSWTALPAVATNNAFLVAAADSLRFAPAANFNGPAPQLTVHLVEDVNGGSAVVTAQTADLTTVGDPTRFSAALTLGQTITAVNDIPTLTSLDPATFAENTVNAAAQAIDSDVTLGDIDSADLNTGTLTVTYTAGGGVQDQLSVLNAVGNITVTGGTTVNFNGNAIGAITTNGVNGADLVVTFNTANATPTAVDALIQALGYANTSHTPALTRTVGITVTDGDGGASTQATALITVNAENDLPLLANVDAARAYREGAGATALDTAPPITLTDVDAPGVGNQIQSATVTITAGSLAPGDVLSADAGATGINVSYASGVLTLSGNDTLADYEAVLRTVTFTADSQNPTSFGAHPTRTVEWTVTDIDGGSSTAAATTVNIVAPTHFNTLWHNTTTDELRDWTFTNGAVTNNSIIAPPVTAWQVAAVGNFNADGIADIVWHNDSTGDTRVWLMNASGQLASSIAQGSALPNWEVAATGDFNGDGMADIVWQNTANGAARVWLMENGVRTSQIAFSGPDATWFVTGVGDFNGDGTDDILWRNAGNGQLRDWTMANGTFIANTPFVGVSLDQKVAATGDFNNDGTDDIIFHNTTTGDITEWLMANATIGSTQSLGNLASDWKLSGAGDYNQDGADDLIWHNSSTGQVVEWVMAAGAQSSTVAIGGTPLDWQVSVNPATHSDLLPLV